MPIKQRASRGSSSSSGDGRDGVAEMVRVGIEKARAKLIDLSLRNTMINYRHSESSARHVRIINENPERLVESISSGRAIDIVPLPPVEAIPRDEDTDAFRSALKEARATDAEWLAAEDARRAAGNRRRNKDKASERALRDRIREQLGMPEWRVATDPKARAQDLGIDPSYDLPMGGRNTAESKGFPKFQTLFFPDRLEPKLASIHGAARTLQEDAGISALYCTVGFLEWYETDDGPTPSYAPLVLLPIDMGKRVVNGEYVYSLAGRDDDETPNVALREKLRQHAIELPEHDPEAGIEPYLASVSAAIRNRPRWRVRRWVTIGLFSFARQAMWSDLDPERWPPSAKPELHDLLQQIYGDAAVDDTNALAPVHDIDEPEVELLAPVLVTDADASQVSAVIDASGGSSLVIQGPPGTGKSQTITNIIANAMWQGKSVLFVSEKMAALNVVKDRLDHMGLGLFCLEVHSAKASKTQVLQSLKDRMETARIRASAQDLERAREARQQARQRLTDYVRVMNSPAGATGLITHDVLWGDASRADRPDGVPAKALEFRFPDPLSIDRFKLAELKFAGKALDAHAAAMGAFAEPVRQPWRGIGNLNLSRFERVGAIDAVTRWAEALDALSERVAAFCETASWPPLYSIADATRAVRIVREIPAAKGPIEATLLPLCLEESCVHSLGRWSDLALQAEQLDALVERVCPADRLADKIEGVPGLGQLAESLGLTDTPMDGLPACEAEARRMAGVLGRAAEVIAHVLRLTERDSTKADALVEVVAAAFLQCVLQFPQKTAYLRMPRLSDDGVLEAIVEAQMIASEVAAAAQRAQFSDPPTPALAASLPTSPELHDAASVLQRSGWFGKLFGRDWRCAKAIWLRAFPSETKIKPTSAARLKAAAQWKEKLVELDGCENAKDAIGRNWKGAATPFAAIVEVAEWMRTVASVTPLSVDGARGLRRRLYEAPSEEVAALSDLASTSECLNLSALAQACYARRTSIAEESVKEVVRVQQFEALLAGLREFAVQPNATANDLARAADAYKDAEDCRREMSAESVANNVLGPVRKGTEAERATVIKSTVQHAAAIRNLKLPPATLIRLMRPDQSVHLANLTELAAAIDVACCDEQAARERADATLQLNPIVWAGAAFDTAAMAALAEKAKRAADAPEDLEKQVALLGMESEAARNGLGGLIDAWSREGMPYKNVAWSIEAAFYRSAAEKLMREHQDLKRHTGNAHDQVRTRFQELDKEILELNRRLIAAKLQLQPIPQGRRAQSTRDYTDNQMLDHQTNLQKPRIALRRLFGNAGDAIRAYKPCIMMSPMSVAQYLEPGKHRFDLLIIDEASQMRPEDALGAMIRCTQAVVVGDPQQLPPSDFFAAGEARTEEELEDAPEESILELGRRSWRPMRMLEVHYRSRHQSLIAYSNREFYDDRLIVYPSPVLEDPDFGVTCQRVDGAYEAGQGRNPEEARAVAEAAAKLMRMRIDRSIGIVAVNKAQADLIGTLIDEIAANDPEIQAYRQAWEGTLEEFFVKNLENVQGDERDIILVSTVYGKTSEGVFHQNFGPLNKNYGHRRLNVLFTRAKRRLALFTSLDHSQIVADGKKRGVRVLKEFLEYASTGTIQHGRATGQEPDSDFERWFLSRLKAVGYEAHPQVGVAGYRIDIGVVHPDRPGNYIIGLECDGATYHSSKSARDRDRLRQSVLEDLNWRIHRVWSTDWYRDPEREFARLVQHIENSRDLADAAE